MPPSSAPSTINGSGEQTRDYVHVGDVARANVLALERDVPSGTYNVGTGVETSVNELYELLLEVSGKELRPRHGPAKPAEQTRSSVDPAKAGRVLGWRPEVDLRSGLHQTLRYFEAAARRRGVYSTRPGCRTTRPPWRTAYSPARYRVRSSMTPLAAV